MRRAAAALDETQGLQKEIELALMQGETCIGKKGSPVGEVILQQTLKRTAGPYWYDTKGEITVTRNAQRVYPERLAELAPKSVVLFRPPHFLF